MKKVTLTLAACLTVAALATPAFSQRRQGAPPQDSPRASFEMEFAGAPDDAGPRRVHRQFMPIDGEMPPPPPGGFGAGPGGFAHFPPMHEMGPMMQHLVRFWENERLVEKMALTEDQIARLEESLESTKSTLEGTEGSIKSAHEKLREALDVDNPDVSAVYDALDGLTSACNEKAKILLGHHVVVKNVLTEEQEEILKKSRREFAQKFDGRIQDSIDDFRGVVRGLLNDGSLSEADWTEIEAKLAPLPEEVQERIRARIKQVEQRVSDGEALDEIEAPQPPRPPTPPRADRRGSGRNLPSLPEE